MKQASRPIGYIACFLASFFWGIHPVLVRYLTQQGISPFLIAGLRLYIGTLTIFLILSMSQIFNRDLIKKLPPIKLNRFFWIAAFSLGIDFILFQLSLRYTLASDAQLIENFSPVVVLIVTSIFLLHRVREVAPTKRFWMSVFRIVIIGSIGASLVLINDTNDKFVPNQIKLLGDLIEVIAMIFFSIFLVANSEFARTNGAISSLRIIMLTLAVAAIPVTFFMPFHELQNITMYQWSIILFIGVFATGFSYWVWHVASKHLNIIPLSLNFIYTGIITVVAEAIFLKLVFDWKFIVGALLMISASVGAEIMNRRAELYLAKQKVQYETGTKQISETS